MKIATGWPADIRRTRHTGDFSVRALALAPSSLHLPSACPQVLRRRGFALNFPTMASFFLDFDSFRWDFPTMKTARLDAKRRLAMLGDLASGDAVSVEAPDADNWLVKRMHPDKRLKLVVVPTIKSLPDDPKWEKIERKLTQAAQENLPEPE